MAFTIATVSGVQDFVAGNKKIRHRKLTFDSSYATGGEPLVASEFGLKKIEHVMVHGAARKSDASDAVICSYDYTNGKLVAYRQKDPAAAGGADIALPQVGNTVDLSSYSVHVTVIGY